MRVEVVIAPLEGDIFEDEQAAGDADCQPQQVEDGVAFALGEVAEGD